MTDESGGATPDADPAPAVPHGPVRVPWAPRWAQRAGLATLLAAPAVAILAVVVGAVVDRPPPWTALASLLLGSAAVAAGLGHLGRWQSDPEGEEARRATTGLLLGYGTLAFAAVVSVAAAAVGAMSPVSDPRGGFTEVAQDTAVVEAQDRLRETPGVLLGTVRDAAGRPVAGADVLVRHDGMRTDSCPAERSTRSGLDGAWLLAVCQLEGDARYRVAVRHPQGTARGPAVDVAAGRTTTVDLVLG